MCQTIKGYSVKNATECAKCDDGQGQLVSAYTWSSPPAPIWTPWKWLPRQVLEGNTYGPGANLTKFRVRISVLSSRRIAYLNVRTSRIRPSSALRHRPQRLQRYASMLCFILIVTTLITNARYQSLIAPLRLLSCDCLSNTSVDCYNQILPSFVGITHMCSYQANSFYVRCVVHLERHLFLPLPLQSAPVGLTTSDTSVFTVSSVVGCTDIQLQLLTASRYFTSKATIYSSLFLDSIKTAPNAVVKNKNGIIVGAIIGDAVRRSIYSHLIVLYLVSQAIVSYDGNATELILCLDIDESADTSGFPVFDFASADPVTYSVDSFRPRFINVTYNDTTTPKKLCTMISGIGLPAQVYLPIKRFSGASSCG